MKGKLPNQEQKVTMAPRTPNLGTSHNHTTCEVCGISLNNGDPLGSKCQHQDCPKNKREEE